MKVRELELADYGKFIRFGRGKMLNLWAKQVEIPRRKEIFVPPCEGVLFLVAVNCIERH